MQVHYLGAKELVVQACPSFGMHGANRVSTFELKPPASEFYATLPENLLLPNESSSPALSSSPQEHQQQRINHQQCAVSSEASVDTASNPFLPKLTKRTVTDRDDYVLFKIEIDSPNVEARNIDYIFQDEDNYIDEVAWEHHVDGNCLMLGQWVSLTTHTSLYDSYQSFLKLRQKGIRAHSWI